MSRIRRTLYLGALIVVTLCVASSLPALAKSQLIHMHNGKVLRVEAVEVDGDWLMVTLTGGHVLGIESRLVDTIEDDLGDDNDTGTSLNVVTSGRYVPKGRSTGNSSRRSVGTQERADPLAGRQAQPAQPQPAGATVGNPNPNGLPGAGQQTPTGGVQGQAGTNLTPALGINRAGRARGRPNPRGNNGNN